MCEGTGCTKFHERNGIGMGITATKTQDGRKVDDFLRSECFTCSHSTGDEYEAEGDRDSATCHRSACCGHMLGGYLYGYNNITYRSGYQTERVLGIVRYILIIV